MYFFPLSRPGCALNPPLNRCRSRISPLHPPLSQTLQTLNWISRWVSSISLNLVMCSFSHWTDPYLPFPPLHLLLSWPLPSLFTAEDSSSPGSPRVTAGSNQTACGQTIVCELATYFMVQGYLPEIRNSKWAVAGVAVGGSFTKPLLFRKIMHWHSDKRFKYEGSDGWS